MCKLSILLLLCAAFQVLAEQLSATVYQERVLNTKAPWLVFFGPSPVDFSSAAFETIHSKVQQYNVQLGAIDCSQKEHKKTCQAFGSQLPSLQLFVDTPKVNPYTKKLYRTPVAHQAKDGSVDLAAIERFVSKSFPNNVQKVVDMDSFTSAKATATKPSVLLFSDKDAVSMLYKSVAYEFADSLNFIQVTRAASEVADKFDVLSLPALLVVGTDDTIKTFNPEDKADFKSRASLAAWLREIVGSGSVDNASPSGTDTTTPEDKTKNASSDSVNSNTPNRFTQLEKNFDVSSVPSDESWVVRILSGPNGNGVAVTGADDWVKTARWCEGKIKAAEFNCDTTDATDRSTLLSIVCSEVATKASAEGGMYFVVPYGTNTGARKRLIVDSTTSVDSLAIRSKLGTYLFAFDQHEAARRTAAESLPEHTVRFLETDSGVQAFMSDNAAQGLLSAIVIADKQNPPSFLRNVALFVGDKAKIGYASNIPSALTNVIGPQKLPTAVLLYPSKPTEQSKPGEMQVAVYEAAALGPMKFGSIVGFIHYIHRMSAFYDDSTASAGASASGNNDGSPVGNVQQSVDTVTSEADWISLCGESFRGICAVALTDGVEATENVLSGALANIGSAGAAFKFLSVDGRCQQQFSAAFEVDQNQVPTVVAFSPSKRRFAAYRGAYSSVRPSLLTANTTTSSTSCSAELTFVTAFICL